MPQRVDDWRPVAIGTKSRADEASPPIVRGTVFVRSLLISLRCPHSLNGEGREAALRSPPPIPYMYANMYTCVLFYLDATSTMLLRWYSTGSRVVIQIHL